MTTTATAPTQHAATATALVDAQDRLWLWDEGLSSWRHDGPDGTKLRDRRDLDQYGPLREPSCQTCWDQRRIRDERTVSLDARPAPCPDCTDGVDEDPGEGWQPRHADTVAVPGVVHGRGEQREAS